MSIKKKKSFLAINQNLILEKQTKAPVILGTFVRKRSSLPSPVDGDICLSNSSLFTLNLPDEISKDLIKNSIESVEAVEERSKSLATNFTQLKSKSNMEKTNDLKKHNKHGINSAKISVNFL